MGRLRALSIAAARRPRRESEAFGFNAVSLMPVVLAASRLIGTIDYTRKGDQLYATLDALRFFSLGRSPSASCSAPACTGPRSCRGDE